MELIPINQITPSKTNQRTTMDKVRLNELADTRLSPVNDGMQHRLLQNKPSSRRLSWI
jgi:hypothetical protein